MATFTRLKSGSSRVQVRRKGKYVNDTFLRRKDAEEWALETERRNDRGEPSVGCREARAFPMHPRMGAADDELDPMQRPSACFFYRSTILAAPISR